MNNKHIRCKATFVNKVGETLRCEDDEGHRSAHYCGDEWWPNAGGLPSEDESWRKLPSPAQLLAWVLVAIGVAGLVMWWVAAHHQ